MKETRLLIADTNISMTSALSEQLSKDPRFRIVGTTADGAEAEMLLESAKPDMVLMDLLLPAVDGLFLLKEIQHMKHPPVVICQSEFHSVASIEAAQRNGASYFIFKPLSLSSVINVLVEYAALLRDEEQLRQTHLELGNRDDRMGQIYQILHELGFSAKYSGSTYLAESIRLAQESPLMLHNMSTGLYQKLSERQHVSSASIERSMRTAISAANADDSLTRRIGDTPTNKTCIQYVLHLLNSQQ